MIDTARQVQSIEITREIIRANGDIETFKDYYGSDGEMDRSEIVDADGTVTVVFQREHEAHEAPATLLERIQRFFRR